MHYGGMHHGGMDDGGMDDVFSGLNFGADLQNEWANTTADCFFCRLLLGDLLFCAVRC